METGFYFHNFREDNDLFLIYQYFDVTDMHFHMLELMVNLEAHFDNIVDFANNSRYLEENTDCLVIVLLDIVIKFVFFVVLN